MSQQGNQEQMAKKHCIICGGEIDRDSQFCYLCGAKQSADPGTSGTPKSPEEPIRTEQPAMPVQPQNSQQGGSGAVPAKNSRTGLLIGVASVAVLLLGVIIGMVVNNLSGGKSSGSSSQYAEEDRKSDRRQNSDEQDRDRDEQDQERDEQDQEHAVPRSWTDNVLMADSDTSYELGDKCSVLGNRYVLRYEIISVSFLNTLTDIPDDASEVWDVSADGSGSVMAWTVPNGSGYDLYIGAENGMAANANCNSLFEYYTNVETIRFNGNYHTQNAETMRFMFSQCKSLTSLDVSDFDTSNVTDMCAMFQTCESLTSLDVSGFDTSKVEDMSWMFNSCGSLRSIDVRGFNTSRVTDMSWMFANCESFTDIDVNNFNTSYVTDMSYMFMGCAGLTEVYITGFDVSRVGNFECMFANTGDLTVHLNGDFPDDQISVVWGN